jgi:hypothetical protein
MNLDKFGRGKKQRLKRLIPFFRLPLAQQNLFRATKEREPSLWEERTPPPSPQNLSETDEEEFSNNERNPFLPRDCEIDPSNLRNNTMSALQQSISDGILASDSNLQDDENRFEDPDSLEQDMQNDSDRQDSTPLYTSTVTTGSSRSKSLIGLDGRPRSSSSSQSQRIFVSNQKAFRLTSEKPISHSHIIKFQAQLDQNDFEQKLEDLIDKSVIKTVVIASKAKLDLVSDKIKRSQLDDLKNYFVDPSCSKPLDLEVWNNDAVIKLLLENFPKDDRAYDDKTSFALRMGDIRMIFDFSNPDVESTSIMEVTQLMVEYIPDDSSLPRTVTDLQQKEAVLLLIKRWPQAIQTSFNSFCITHHRKNLEVYDFLENFSSWCQDARKTKQQAISANWIVSASASTAYLKGSTSYSDAARVSSEEAARKRKLEEQSKHANATQKQQKQHLSQNQTAQYEKTQCNHCNRVHSGACPFLPWHKEANKEANVPFAESAMGKKLKEGLNYSYLSHLKYSDGSEIKNVPSGFKCPQQPQQPRSIWFWIPLWSSSRLL